MVSNFIAIIHHDSTKDITISSNSVIIVTIIIDNLGKGITIIGNSDGIIAIVDNGDKSVSIIAIIDDRVTILLIMELLPPLSTM